MSTPQLNSIFFSKVNILSKFMKKLTADTTSKFEVNCAYLLIFCLVYSYGYQGAINVREWYVQTPLSIYFLCLITMLFYLGKTKNYFKFEICIQNKDAMVFSVILICWLFLSFKKYISPLSGDQFYYAISSRRHEISLILKFFPTFLNDFKMNHLLYIFDKLIIIACFFGLFLFYRFRLNLYILLFSVLLIFYIFRFSTILSGGGGSPYGPLQVLPLWISSALFGINDFSFRFPQALGLIFISFFIYFFFKNKVKWSLAAFIGASTCCIPLLLHVSTINEASIWTTTAWSTALIFTILFKNTKFNQWLALSTFISILTLFRAPVFLIYIYLIPVFWIIHSGTNLIKFKKSILLLIPTTVFIPFLAFNLIAGTPAMYASWEIFNIPNSDYAIFRIWYAFYNLIILNTSLSTVGIIYMIPIFSLFLFKNRNLNFRLKIILFLFFVLAIFMFFAIRPTLWTTDRYKSEYIIPFSIISFCLIFDSMLKSKFSIFLITFISTFMIFLGLNGFYNYRNPNQFIIQTDKYPRETELFYDYKSALVKAKNDGYANYTIISGSTSGVIPQIISGYTVNEVKKSQTLLKLPIQSISDWTSVDPNLVNDFSEIKLVLITDSGDKLLADKFISLGWKIWNIFPIDGGGTVTGLIR